MAPVKIKTAYLPVEVELWDAVYVTVDLTSAESDLETDLYAEALAAEEEAESIEAWAKYLDLILKPADGTKRKAGTALKREFKEGRITARQVVGITLQIKAAEQGETAKVLQRLAAGRPT